VKKTLQRLLTEYGPVALVVYLAIFFTVLFGAWAAIHLGWRPESVAGSVGTFTAAYLATKVTQPLRIAATIALTPLASRVHRRLARTPEPPPEPPLDPPPEP
jgi:hypothetical protein